jgi:hypothetical protein
VPLHILAGSNPTKVIIQSCARHHFEETGAFPQSDTPGGGAKMFPDDGRSRFSETSVQDNILHIHLRDVTYLFQNNVLFTEDNSAASTKYAAMFYLWRLPSERLSFSPHYQEAET